MSSIRNHLAVAVLVSCMEPARSCLISSFCSLQMQPFPVSSVSLQMQPCYIIVKQKAIPLTQCFWVHYLLLCLQVLSLESKCQDFQVNIAALSEEISERESVIAQNYTTIQLLRRRLADMEKHKFVLGYRTQVQPTPLCSCRLCLCWCFPMTFSCACHLGCSSSSGFVRLEQPK